MVAVRAFAAGLHCCPTLSRRLSCRPEEAGGGEVVKSGQTTCVKVRLREWAQPRPNVLRLPSSARLLFRNSPRPQVDRKPALQMLLRTARRMGSTVKFRRCREALVDIHPFDGVKPMAVRVSSFASRVIPHWELSFWRLRILQHRKSTCQRQARGIMIIIQAYEYYVYPEHISVSCHCCDFLVCSALLPIL